ncbi:polysaccharide deacetylase family protein [Bacillaceae bacterium S4-13-56]
MYDTTDTNVITSSIDPNRKSVILTFDDGPSRVLKPILDILKEEDVPAMFFWQTKLLHPKRPWKRVLEEGHSIGTHTIKHPELTKLSYDAQMKEIALSKEQISQTTGSEVKYFRPPFGRYNEDTLKIVAELGLSTVLWRIAAIDWELKDTPEQIIANVVENLEDGAVILLHELKQTVLVLPELIQEIKKQGYSFKLL